ncbi:hypothetical protein LTR17_003738 [Elasticomyces elasticus]|nr:hypothetical protein LTR17_003738 [Elasticomyces elasticus]
MKGHALYFKVPATRMRPGTCGYFSEAGQWRDIVHLAEVEPHTSCAKDWNAPSQTIRVISDGGIEWPIKLSKSVTEISVGADLKANVPGAPVSGGFTMNFQTKRGAGAVLITAGEVTCHQLERDLLAWQWVLEQQNMQKLLTDWREISEQKRTLWMVTGTYTAKSCALSVLSSPESSVKIGLDVEVANVAQASPSVEWWKSKSDGSWNKYREDDSGVVVFMSGIAFKVGLFKRSQVSRKFSNLDGPACAAAADRRSSMQSIGSVSKHLHRAAPTTSLQYPLEDEDVVEDPWVADIVPEYIGKESRELEGELESLIGAEAEADEEDEV